MFEGMMNDIQSVILNEEQIQSKISELGKQISKDYEGKNLLVVGVLKGAVVFFADIIRKIENYCDIDFMVVSSYGNGTESKGMIQIHKDLSVDVSGRDVIIVEDIMDSGVTLFNLKNVLTKRGANSVKICTFLDKPSRRKIDIKADYIGLEVPDEFVVGYGLDYAEKYRNLPFVGILKRQVYEK